LKEDSHGDGLVNMEPLMVVFVSGALILTFVAFAVNPMQVAIEEAVRSDAQLQAQRIVSVINLMETAPDGTSYSFDMPNTKCNVAITDDFVKITLTQATGGGKSHTSSIIKTSTKIKTGNFVCSNNMNIMFRKNGMLDIGFR